MKNSSLSKILQDFLSDAKKRIHIWLILYSLYKKTDVTTQLFVAIRLITAPFLSLELYVPKRGMILDLGCGHGLFSFIAAITSLQRKIVGIDPDISKLNAINSIHNYKTRVTFNTKTLQELVKIKKKFQAIVIIDVVYLLPKEELVNTLLLCQKLLTKKGKIVLKTSQMEKGLGHWLAFLQEKIMVQALRRTKSSSTGLYFRTLDEYRSLFTASGLEVQVESRLKTIFFHPHYLFVLKKSNK